MWSLAEEGTLVPEMWPQAVEGAWLPGLQALAGEWRMVWRLVSLSPPPALS